jgi:SAM-dependent methyltransferase
MTVSLQSEAFFPQTRCWVCDGSHLSRFHQARFDFDEYRRQDPELSQYSGRTVWLVRCHACGFGQPEALPVLPRFFERMYDQRWSSEWVEGECHAAYKDLIFETILAQLERRVPRTAERRLLDVGAHVGRFMQMAQRGGWAVEGIEVNPTTAACAERRTGSTVHRRSIGSVAEDGRRFTALTLTDVLEHIPDPVAVLRSAAALLVPGGVVAVKVPSGPGQWLKERARAALRPSHKISIAGNLVHVNHFSVQSLRLALERAGFRAVTIAPGAPELHRGGGVGHRLSNAVRLSVYAAAHIPAGVHSPLALNLQAYACAPS